MGGWTRPSRPKFWINVVSLDRKLSHEKNSINVWYGAESGVPATLRSSMNVLRSGYNLAQIDPDLVGVRISSINHATLGKILVHLYATFADHVRFGGSIDRRSILPVPSVWLYHTSSGSSC